MPHIWKFQEPLFTSEVKGENGTFLCQSKKISFLKINLLNLGKNLVGPWGSTQLGERSPKPVSHLKSETRKVSHLTGPQNRPTCTCSTLPRASARTPPLGVSLGLYACFLTTVQSTVNKKKVSDIRSSRMKPLVRHDWFLAVR